MNSELLSAGSKSARRLLSCAYTMRARLGDSILLGDVRYIGSPNARQDWLLGTDAESDLAPTRGGTRTLSQPSLPPTAPTAQPPPDRTRPRALLRLVA